MRLPCRPGGCDFRTGFGRVLLKVLSKTAGQLACRFCVGRRIAPRLFWLHHLRGDTFTGGGNIESEDVVSDSRRRFQTSVVNGVGNGSSKSQRHSTTHAVSAAGLPRVDKPDGRIVPADSGFDVFLKP
jgi:hypothetical protein